MGKKRVFLLIALVLVVAMTVGLFAGCKPSDGSTVIFNGGNQGNSGKTSILSNADALQSFLVSANTPIDNIANYVNVYEVTTKSSVGVSFGSKGKDNYVINPPIGGYKVGKTYAIELKNGVNFVTKEYSASRVLRFTVTTNSMANVKLNSGVVEYPSDHIIGNVAKQGVNNDGSEYGSFNFQTNGEIELNQGDVIIVNNDDNNLKEAFKIKKVAKTSNANVVAISYEKPDVSEVYEELEYGQTTPLTGYSDIEFLHDQNGGNVEQLENSQLATAIVSIFGKKPEFNINAELLDNGIRATIGIVIPDVVLVEGFGSTSLVVEIVNDLTMDADTSVLLATLAQDIKDAQFGVTANIKNQTNCVVRISSGASLTEIANVQELYEKLDALAKQQSATENEASVALPLFRWMLPLAGGALNIGYDADLAFRFSFSGQFELKATGSLEYAVGVTYNQEQGVKVVTDNIKESDKWMDSVAIKMEGTATVKLGVIQRLGIDLLGGVLSAKVEAEIGNYNRVYGYAQTNNLLEEDKYMVGSIYFDGGFYYDVNLILAVKLGPLVLADQRAAIASGEISLYDAGERELELGIVAMPVLTLTSLETAIPTYYVECYDLVTRAKYKKAIDVTELTVVSQNINNIKVVDGNLIVDNTSGFNNSVIEVAYKEFPATTTKVSFNGAFYVKNADFDFDKADKQDLNVNVVSTNGFEDVAVYSGDNLVVSTLTAQNDREATLTISYKELVKLDSGINNLQVRLGDLVSNMNVSVVGSVSWGQFKLSGNVYDIFTADQIVSMTESSTDFTGVTLSISQDIDMGGKVINPINNFAGTILGNGYTISNYTIGSMIDNKSAFIINNKGVIDSVTLAGDVNVEFVGAFKNQYDIAGVVAINNGSINNVEYTGVVNVASNSVSSFITYNVGAIASINKGTIAECNASNAVVNVTAKFALVDATYNVGGITANSNGTAVNFKTSFGVESTMKIYINGVRK